MRWTFLAGRVVCLVLSLSRPVRAQPSEAAVPTVAMDGAQEAPESPVPTASLVEDSPAPEATPSVDDSSADAAPTRTTVVRGRTPPPPESPERRDPTGAITVIDARERAGEARDTAELLVGSVGLAVQDSGGYGQSKSLVVRGASSNGVLVFLDGIPLNGAGGLSDLSLIPSALVERFEVLRGGAGARYGSGGLGGAVNIITRAPGPSLRTSGEVTYGSWNTALGHVAATGPLLGGQALVLVHGGRSDGDFAYDVDDLPAVDGNPQVSERRARNNAQGGGALLRYRRRLAGGSRLDALAELSVEERAIPGTVQNPQSTGDQGLGRLALGLRWSGVLDGVGQGSARGFFRRDALEVTGRIPGAGGAQRHSVGGVELEGRRPLGEHQSLTVTVATSGENVTQAENSQAAAWWRASVMAMDELRLFDGVLDVVPAMRLERVGPYWLLSPKLGASVELGRGFGLRANAGQSHRAPSFLELYIRQGTLLPNPGLKPERALYMDAAVMWRSGRVSDEDETPRWSVTAGGFAALYENLIAYELYPPLMARPYNFDTARVWGLELEGEARPFPWLLASTGYTWLRTENRYGDPRFFGKDLPYRPRHKWVGRVRAGPDWLNARAEVLYQSVQRVNRTGSLDLPSRTLVSAGASSTFLHKPEVTVSVELKNLLDVRTFDFTGFPLPGRAVYVTLAMALEPGASSTATSPQEPHASPASPVP
ncbi:TonB-dependent receptor [Comamonas sp. JC664]|uniref:TonB-dependent receptor plug domain-containing protein n=1 Tax=Comamonas sp. JC664 TaxID=2801917 RepID=UPI00174CCE52|nr:TonB-dependent receptor [Comamonas sp. JC664]MBL0694863.1 TonB-dependent receptor [Comamonas sp. JC664]GHG94965.1 TonB-dependent receptor [Comamonas sp. KCTC 72670]